MLIIVHVVSILEPMKHGHVSNKGERQYANLPNSLFQGLTGLYPHEQECDHQIPCFRCSFRMYCHCYGVVLLLELLPYE